MAIVHAEAEAEAEAVAETDPQFWGARPSGWAYAYQTYHNTPAATAPLVTAPAVEGEAPEGVQRVMLNPYSGAYNPNWYNGLYGGYPGYGAGYAGYGGYPGYSGYVGYGAGAYGGGWSAKTDPAIKMIEHKT